MRDHDDSSAPDDRCEFLDERVSVYDESLSATEPPIERPCLPTGEGGGARVAQRIMDGENRSKSRRQRQQTGVVVLVNVHDLGAPSAELSSYREHSRDGRDRSNTTRDDEHLDPLAAEAFDQLVSFGSRPPELEGVRTAEHGNVVIDPN